MAIPFFILAGNFSHPWRRRPADDQFRHLHGRPLAWRPRPFRRSCLRPLCRRFRLLAGNRCRHRRHPDPGHGQGRISDEVRAGVIATSGRFGDSHPAVHRHGYVLHRHQHLGGRPVYGRGYSGHRHGRYARRHDLVPGPQVQLPPPAQGIMGRALGSASASRSGPDADHRRYGWYH